eukprot:2661970-Pyramimonas_sp.AAC.1
MASGGSRPPPSTSIWPLGGPDPPQAPRFGLWGVQIPPLAPLYGLWGVQARAPRVRIVTCPPSPLEAIDGTPALGGRTMALHGCRKTDR